MTHQKFEGERTLMRIHIGESDKWHGKPLHEAIVDVNSHQRPLALKFLVRIHIGESDKWHGKPLHEAIVELLRKDGFSGVTVLRGVAGYGSSSVYHTDKLLRLSQDLPIILEVIETQERIDQMLPRLDEMVDGGLITLEKVRVILYRPAKR